MTILPFEVHPMADDELNLVRATWMHSSWGHRSDINRAIDEGSVTVARTADGLCLGWVAHNGDTVSHGWVRDGYRGLGVMRTLWERAGKPCVLGKDPTTRAKRVLRALLDGAQKEAS